jgi:hypothetical protein
MANGAMQMTISAKINENFATILFLDLGWALIQNAI